MENKNENNLNRRNFLRNAGAVAAASVFAVNSYADPNENPKTKQSKSDGDSGEKEDKIKMPHRVLGKTKAKVPILNLGGTTDFTNSQALLARAAAWQITYWDTAYGYAGGKSELGIGRFLAQKDKKFRKKMFICTKASGGWTPDEIETRLQKSLKRLNTDYIDLYYLHAMSRPDQLTEEIRKWAQSAKERKLIRFFGFTTHSNMAECLQAASKVDWIDAIMTKYNYRMMDDEKMDKALTDCHEAKIGLVAMKTQAKGINLSDTEKFVKGFTEKGYSPEQANLKAVWADHRITTICSRMKNVGEITANLSAALDEKMLTPQQLKDLMKHAEKTRANHCLGCANLCAAASPQMPYIADVLRCLMYKNTYGEYEKAAEVFAELPSNAKANLASADYTNAQNICPQSIPIAVLMNQAKADFA